jgi:hypothetical protein
LRILQFVKEHIQIAQPQNDYKELLELTMVFLGDKKNSIILFRTPDAIHHAKPFIVLKYISFVMNLN